MIFWHYYFGASGFVNYLTVLYTSNLFAPLAKGEGSTYNYNVNSTEYT